MILSEISTPSSRYSHRLPVKTSPLILREDGKLIGELSIREALKNTPEIIVRVTKIENINTYFLFIQIVPQTFCNLYNRKNLKLNQIIMRIQELSSVSTAKNYNQYKQKKLTSFLTYCLLKGTDKNSCLWFHLKTSIKTIFF